MGTWGTGSFENDDALDFVARLEREGKSAIRATLGAVNKLDARDYLEAPEASSAIAAAEIVAAARDGKISRLPEAARQWLDEHRKSVTTESLFASALSAVKRVLTQSELKELWVEGGANTQSKAWASGVSRLIKRLSADTARVAKAKKPKGPKVRKVAFEPGAVLRVGLDGERHTYARMLARHPMIAFYECRVAAAVQDVFAIVERPVLFVLAVNDGAYSSGRWPKIGHVPLDRAPIPIPDQFMQDIGTDQCQIVDDLFNARPAAPEECIGLERVAVWGAEHVEERIRDHYTGQPHAHLAYLKVRLPARK